MLASALLLLALVLPTVAYAHVTVLPAFLEDGQRSTLTFTAPNERPPHSVTRLTVTFPAGFELTADPATAGWSLAVVPGKAVWSGGVTRPHEIGRFRLEAKTSLAPTGMVLEAVQRYDDGGAVHWTIPFTVLPAARAPKQHLVGALIAGIVGVLVIVVGLVALRYRHGARA